MLNNLIENPTSASSQLIKFAKLGDDYTPSGFYGLGVIKMMFSSYIIRDGYQHRF